MTSQEIFDIVVTHLRKQGKPAMNNIGGCSYRGVDGTKCAVGCLIPDSIYKSEMEGSIAEELVIQFEGLYHLIEHKHLLGLLQSAHDKNNTIGYWANFLEKDLQEIANQNNLVYTEATK